MPSRSYASPNTRRTVKVSFAAFVRVAGSKCGAAMGSSRDRVSRRRASAGVNAASSSSMDRSVLTGTTKLCPFESFA